MTALNDRKEEGLMLARQYNLAGNERITPPPISALIQAANLFGCDIYIKSEQHRINVKSYDELQSGIQRQRTFLIFYFDGADEKEADVKFRKLLGI